MPKQQLLRNHTTRRINRQPHPLLPPPLQRRRHIGEQRRRVRATLVPVPPEVALQVLQTRVLGVRGGEPLDVRLQRRGRGAGGRGEGVAVGGEGWGGPVGGEDGGEGAEGVGELRGCEMRRVEMERVEGGGDRPACL